MAALLGEASARSEEERAGRGEVIVRRGGGGRRRDRGTMPRGEGSRWSRRRSSASAEKEENPNKVKANFALSGALASDVQTGNSRQGVTLKFSEHLEARVPNTRWRLYLYRKKDASSRRRTQRLSRQTSYMLGREREVATDVLANHPPLSKQRAVLQYRALPLWEERGRIICSH
jgi:smad nuclear-interacting protein 1